MTTAEKIQAAIDTIQWRVKMFEHFNPRVWQEIYFLHQQRKVWDRHISPLPTGEQEKFRALWPEFCFLPLAVLSKFDVLAGAPMIYPSHVYAPDLVSLAAWRLSKGVYAFDETLLQELWRTKCNEIPLEVITRLPEYSIVLPVPDGAFPMLRARAVMVHISELGRKDVLCVSFLCGPGDAFEKVGDYVYAYGGTFTLPIMKTVEESCDFILDCIAKEGHTEPFESHKEFVKDFLGKSAYDEFYGQDEGGEIAKALYTAGRDDLRGLLSTILYLCAEEPDVQTRAKNATWGAKPRPVQIKKEMKFMAAQQVTQWDVGVRIGAAIRAYQKKEDQSWEPGTHRSPRPHIRDAHWHLFWTGSRQAPVPKIRWLAPIPVNVRYGPLSTVVRPVGHGLKESSA